jgi:superfamily I DNA and/or RNA helicase
LAGVLSAKNPNGGNAIEKFILIGDHKQLPAVVLQNETDSRTDSAALNAIGIIDRRNSLFERLYNLHKENKQSPVWGMLHKQGRMHPDIAVFPNQAFYQGLLLPVPTVHQVTPLEFSRYDNNNPVQALVATKRLAFINVHKSREDTNAKANSREASIAVTLVKQLYELYQQNDLLFDAHESIGIIAPYRNQIALIRREIHNLHIPELDNIMVDTVERFQGSQRDIIIYSFTISHLFQLRFLANNVSNDGYIVDRKLNVALTRAKKQLFITGNIDLLSNNPVYQGLIAFIRSRDGLVAGEQIMRNEKGTIN